MTKPFDLAKHKLISRLYKNNTSNMFMWKILAFVPKRIEYLIRFFDTSEGENALCGMWDEESVTGKTFNA